MNLNERNYAGDHVVVGSLEVLGDIKGKSIKQIRRNIELIQQQAEVINRTQERYWEELSSDNMITPLEKQQLLKEIKSIQQSYTAIYAQALSIGQESSEYVQDYIATYNDLYSYLYTVLHLFDDMTTVTDIENRQTFNTKFFNYYYSESFVLVALSKGLLDSVSIRVLDSLLDEGEEGDVGIYHGALYQYVNGAWKNVSTGNYKGALSTLPLAEQDAFFLASDNFIVSQELWVNGQQLQVNDGNGLDALAISRLFRKGYIYYCQDGAWFEQTDKTNYMYVAAFADVLNITGELPQIFQDAIDDLQQQIDANRVPKYRGPSATNPADPVEGDYFVYSGTTTVTRRNSDIYQYQNGEWVRLDPLQSQNSPYYMQALDDILQLNNADNGYFAALFAQALFANNAFLYALSTKLITLRGPDGYIQSDNYNPESPESAGFRISHNGNADFNGDTHIAGKVAIGVPLRGNSDLSTYDCVIGGNTLINGVLKALRFELIGVTAGDVVQREYNNIFDVDRTRNTYNLCSLTRGTMRIKITYNVTQVQTIGPYIQIGNDKTKFTQTGSGVLTKDVSFTEYENIKVIISDAGEALDGGGRISVSNIKVCLSADDTIFKNFLQFFLVDSYVDRTR